MHGDGLLWLLWLVLLERAKDALHDQVTGVAAQHGSGLSGQDVLQARLQTIERGLDHRMARVHQMSALDLSLTAKGGHRCRSGSASSSSSHHLRGMGWMWRAGPSVTAAAIGSLDGLYPACLPSCGVVERRAEKIRPYILQHANEKRKDRPFLF